MQDVIVIGGGAAGMMAAAQAAGRGARVLLLERGEQLGRKLRITGKGRCNVTNNCDMQGLMQNVARNPKFLYSAFSAFSAQDCMAFFEQNGVPLKTERGNRVFPVSDKAADIVFALQRAVQKAGARVQSERVKRIDATEDGFLIKTDKEIHRAKKVILATGGVSYPKTGSTGDGYRMAESLGHTVIAPSASLVGLRSDDPCCAEMSGLSLRNVSIKVVNGKGKTVYDDFGEMLFTHGGISGPLVLSASAHLKDFEKNLYTMYIDMKPALSESQLDDRLLRDFQKYSNRQISNALSDLLPASMILPMLDKAGIDYDMVIHQMTKEQRRALLQCVKAFSVSIVGTESVEGAVITRGGVSVKEVDPRSMESKLCKGLYFAGEILDTDAYTGGFNLQIAFATGYLAGLGAAGGL